MALTVYALPALVALLSKVFVYLYHRRSKVRGLQIHLFLGFLLFLGLQNLAEIGVVSRFDLELAVVAGDICGRLWFASAVLAVAFFLHFSIATALYDEARGRQVHRGLIALLYAPPIALETLLWTGPLFIVGFETMGYTLTRIPGPLYVLWEAYLVAYLTAAIGFLAYGAVFQSAPFRRLQNSLLLLGFVPMALFALTIVALQRVGFRGFNATATLPFTSTFLLIVAAYAIYHFRLLDVAFYIPWSKARRKKTELYARLERLATEIRSLESPWDILELIANSLRCHVALLGGPQPWSATPRNQAASESHQFVEFPSEALEKIDRIMTAEEVAHTDPELYKLMVRYRVGAIVPFRTHRAIPGYCLLLGEQFNEEIYSSLDFKVADRLFSAMAQRFFEDFLLVRSQLDHVQEQLHGAKRNLMRAEQNVAGVRLRLTAARKENRMLRDEVARLRRANFRLVQQGSGRAPGPTLPLDAFLAEREREAVVTALERTAGERPAAARLLGIPLHTLNRLIDQYRIDLDGLREP